MKRLDRLIPGEPAPLAGVYRAVTETGDRLELSVVRKRFEPLPRAAEGAGWMLETVTAA